MLFRSNSDVRVTQQTGFANGSLNHQPGLSFQVPGDNEIGLPYDNVEVPRTDAIWPYLIQADWANVDDNSVTWHNNLEQNVFMKFRTDLNILAAENRKLTLEDNNVEFIVLEDGTGFLFQEISDY